MTNDEVRAKIRHAMDSETNRGSVLVPNEYLEILLAEHPAEIYFSYRDQHGELHHCTVQASGAGKLLGETTDNLHRLLEWLLELPKIGMEAAE